MRPPSDRVLRLSMAPLRVAAVILALVGAALSLVSCGSARADEDGTTRAAREVDLALQERELIERRGRFPAFTGYVVDAARILPAAEEDALKRQLGLIQQRTAHQVAVVTVPSLNGIDVATYTSHLANRWGVGRRGHDDGVVFLVAPSERRLRIAVGDGLRNVLTDEECEGIIRDVVLPYFRAGDLASGVTAGVNGIEGEL